MTQNHLLLTVYLHSVMLTWIHVCKMYFLELMVYRTKRPRSVFHASVWCIDLCRHAAANNELQCLDDSHRHQHLIVVMTIVDNVVVTIRYRDKQALRTIASRLLAIVDLTSLTIHRLEIQARGKLSHNPIVSNSASLYRQNAICHDTKAEFYPPRDLVHLPNVLNVDQFDRMAFQHFAA